MADARGRYLGAAIGGVAGGLAAVLGASGLPEPEALVARVVGALLGLVIAAVAVIRARAGSTSGEWGSAFRTRRYRLVVVAEVPAIGVGAPVISATGNARFVGPWVALVVGVHFVAFGKLFGDGQTLLGIGLIAAAVAGAFVGVLGSSRNAAEATTWLTAAVLFLGFAGRTLLGSGRGPGGDNTTPA